MLWAHRCAKKEACPVLDLDFTELFEEDLGTVEYKLEPQHSKPI